MTPLCAGQTHVYRANPSTSPSTSSGQHSGGAAARCDCGAQANNPPMSGYTFPNYTPNPHHPRYPPGTPGGVWPPVAEPEIPASVKVKAIEAGASHLSADGLTGYRAQMGRVEWIDLESSYPSWWPVDDGIMPCGVVSVE